jgi:RHS repeat-associated protein
MIGSYDAAGQLLTEDGPFTSDTVTNLYSNRRGLALSYAYNKAWNLNYRTNNGALSTFTVDTRNQLVSVPGGSCSYDANGNLVTNTATGLGYAYDDENRLVTAQYAPWTNSPGPPPELSSLMPQPQYTPGWKVNFTYDGLGRLRVRTDYANTTNGWYLTNTVLYVYDGNRVIQERNAANTPTVSYTRGNDLSGSLEGAGGIGGLLARSSGYSSGNWTSHAYYHADGNGNIICLVDANQAVAASYRYDPFGNLISKSGTLADANLYRFSSKEFHVNSGLYYYLYRFYDPNTQRWINRDPIQETGGQNLYSYVENEPVATTDSLGLKLWYCTRKTDKGPPTFGMGRHGYIWDDRPGVDDKDRECGQEACSGLAPCKGTGSGGQGPTPDGKWDGSIGDNGRWSNGTFECAQIPGSEGKEPDVMDYCNQHINHRPWLPPLWDCHTGARHCLRHFDLDLPPFRRWNFQPPFGGKPPPPVRPPKWPYGFNEPHY